MDENEAESETDKQAALAGSDRNVNGNDPLQWGHWSPLWSFTFGVTTQQILTYIVSDPSLEGDFSSEAFECRGSGGRCRAEAPETEGLHIQWGLRPQDVVGGFVFSDV